MHVFNELPHPKRALPRVVLDAKNIKTNLGNKITKQFYQKILEMAHGPNNVIPGDYRDPDFRKRLKFFKENFQGDPALYKELYETSMSESYLLENVYAPPDTSEIHDLLTFNANADHDELEKDIFGQTEMDIQDDMDELMSTPEKAEGEGEGEVQGEADDKDESNINSRYQSLKLDLMEEMALQMDKERHSYIKFDQVLSEKRKHERLYKNYIPPLDELIIGSQEKQAEDPEAPIDFKQDQIGEQFSSVLHKIIDGGKNRYDSSERIKHLQANVAMSYNTAEDALRSPEPLVLGAKAVLDAENDEKMDSEMSIEQLYFEERERNIDKAGAIQHETTIPLPHVLLLDDKESKLDASKVKEQGPEVREEADEDVDLQEALKRVKAEWDSKGEKDVFDEIAFQRSYKLTQKMVQESQRDYLRYKQKQHAELEEQPEPFEIEKLHPKVEEWMQAVMAKKPGQPQTPKEVRLRKEISKDLKKKEKEKRKEVRAKKKRAGL